MSVATLTGPDLRTHEAVMRELDADTRIDASDIGVSAKDDEVTLTGFVDSYGAKLGAERAAKRVRGVRAVANDLEVRLRFERADDDIARDAAEALQLQTRVPPHVHVSVHKGHITLTGSVEWMFQREAAENAVRYIAGVTGVQNHVHVVPATAPADSHHTDTHQHVAARLTSAEATSFVRPRSRDSRTPGERRVAVRRRSRSTPRQGPLPEAR